MQVESTLFAAGVCINSLPGVRLGITNSRCSTRKLTAAQMARSLIANQCKPNTKSTRRVLWQTRNQGNRINRMTRREARQWEREQPLARDNLSKVPSILHNKVKRPDRVAAFRALANVSLIPVALRKAKAGSEMKSAVTSLPLETERSRGASRTRLYSNINARCESLLRTVLFT